MTSRDRGMTMSLDDMANVRPDEAGLPKHAIDFKIPYEDLDLDLDDELGSGSFAQVFKGTYLGTEVAIKKIVIPDDEPDLVKYVKREVVLLNSLRHPHIVQFLGWCHPEDTNYLLLVEEFIKGGTLHKFLASQEANKDYIMKTSLCLDIAKAIYYLHRNRVLYRDLKSENVLVDDGKNPRYAKLVDFGFARTIDEYSTRRGPPMTICGTDAWMAPEVIMGMDYDERSDVFSFGVVLLECILGTEIVKHKLEREPRRFFELDMNLARSLVPSNCPTELVELAMYCCAYESSGRPAFMEVMTALDNILLKDKAERAALAKSPSPEPVIQVMKFEEYSLSEVMSKSSGGSGHTDASDEVDINNYHTLSSQENQENMNRIIANGAKTNSSEKKSLHTSEETKKSSSQEKAPVTVTAAKSPQAPAPQAATTAVSPPAASANIANHITPNVATSKSPVSSPATTTTTTTTTATASSNAASPQTHIPTTMTPARSLQQVSVPSPTLRASQSTQIGAPGKLKDSNRYNTINSPPFALSPSGSPNMFDDKIAEYIRVESLAEDHIWNILAGPNPTVSDVIEKIVKKLDKKFSKVELYQIHGRKRTVLAPEQTISDIKRKWGSDSSYRFGVNYYDTADPLSQSGSGGTTKRNRGATLPTKASTMPKGGAFAKEAKKFSKEHQ